LADDATFGVAVCECEEVVFGSWQWEDVGLNGKD